MSKQKLDNLKVNGIQQGVVDFYGLVLRGLQAKYGTNVSGSTQVLTEFNNIVHADNIRTLKIDTLTSTQYIANSLVNSQGVFVNSLAVDAATGTIPTGISNVYGTFIKPHEVLIGEYDFRPNNYSVSSNVLVSFVNNTLDQNATYANAGVQTALEWAITNNYANNYNSLNADSFSISAGSKAVDDSIQMNDAMLKTTFVRLLN
jgi:hypothetical protein